MKTDKIDRNRCPCHVAIIMDGNGRWAQSRAKPRIEGHRQGVENVRQIVEAAGNVGIQCLTLYAFSAENWKRPSREIQALMELLEQFLKRNTKTLIEKQIQLRTIGNIEELPHSAQDALYKTKEETKPHAQQTLVLALNYGSRQEVVSAASRYAGDVKKGLQAETDLEWDTFTQYLDTAGLPDPELLIRTSGEMRLSNYLLLQCAYAELAFSPLYWPEFNQEAFYTIIEEYQSRERRFGLTGEQLHSSEDNQITSH